MNFAAVLGQCLFLGVECLSGEVHKLGLELYLAVLCTLSLADFGINVEGSVLVVFIQICNYFEVTDMCLRTGVYEHVTLDTCETPVVLILEIVTIAELEHLDGDFVLAGFYIRSDVEF